MYSLQQRICFILNNHETYCTPERLQDAMQKWNIKPEEFDLSIEKWFHTIRWWDNKDFMDSLKQCGVDCEQPFQIRQIERRVTN